MKRITNGAMILAFTLLVVITLPMTQSWAIIVKGMYINGKEAWLEYSDQIVTVNFKKGTTTEQMQDIAMKYDSALIPDRIIDNDYPGFKKMEVPAKLSRNQFIKNLLQEDFVDYVTPLCFIDKYEYILTNEFVVKFKPGVTEQEIEAFNSQHPVAVIRKLLWVDGEYRYRFEVTPDSPLNAVEMSNLYYDASIIEYANPSLGPLYNILCKTTPNDPLFYGWGGYQWSLNNTGPSWPGGYEWLNPMTADADIDAVEAWDYETVSNDIIIAVIDTGVYLTHEDLQANLWKNSDEIPDNGIDDDNNGYEDDYDGWDFRNYDNNPSPVITLDYPNGDPHGFFGAIAGHPPEPKPFTTIEKLSLTAEFYYPVENIPEGVSLYGKVWLAG